MDTLLFILCGIPFITCLMIYAFGYRPHNALINSKPPRKTPNAGDDERAKADASTEYWQKRYEEQHKG